MSTDHDPKADPAAQVMYSQGYEDGVADIVNKCEKLFADTPHLLALKAVAARLLKQQATELKRNALPTRRETPRGNQFP